MTTENTPDHTATAEQAVLELLHRQMDAWAAGDGAAFAATFTEDCDFVSVIGEFIQGRAELAVEMQRGFDGFMRGTRLAEPLRRTLRFPTPETAVLITMTPRPAPPDAPAGPERSIQTRVAVCAAGRWLFTSFHNTHVGNPLDRGAHRR
ncbi:SgcJ/EcaC family oxidoreductase [Nocardia neocaledoniensis]|uniref:SgcJ/EcaC family oxidoreductase n=1 Tax=Nocardia neocaledoniensis TaxID=236511 RepID=UPI0024542092|nr:SgcJ/EcaC family oxidoreductase [Nocardia neocaledoniensis]